MGLFSYYSIGAEHCSVKVPMPPAAFATVIVTAIVEAVLYRVIGTVTVPVATVPCGAALATPPCPTCTPLTRIAIVAAPALTAVVLEILHGITSTTFESLVIVKTAPESVNGTVAMPPNVDVELIVANPSLVPLRTWVILNKYALLTLTDV
jgi:hypothetical protein